MVMEFFTSIIFISYIYIRNPIYNCIYIYIHICTHFYPNLPVSNQSFCVPGPRPGNFIRGVNASIGEGALASDGSGVQFSCHLSSRTAASTLYTFKGCKL